MGHLKTNRRPCQYLSACAQPHHAGSDSHRQLFYPHWGSETWLSRCVNEQGKFVCQRNPLPHAEGSAKQSIKRHLHTTHMGAVCWEPHGSSPKTCAWKADHGFGVCVPLALICLLKIANETVLLHKEFEIPTLRIKFFEILQFVFLSHWAEWLDIYA